MNKECLELMKMLISDEWMQPSYKLMKNKVVSIQVSMIGDLLVDGGTLAFKYAYLWRSSTLKP
jgi:hypothetical protein